MPARSAARRSRLAKLALVCTFFLLADLAAARVVPNSPRVPGFGRFLSVKAGRFANCATRPVVFVSGDRIPEMREMNANLVRSSRSQLGFQKTEAFPARQQPEDRMRRLALLRNADSALTRGLQILEQW